MKISKRLKTTIAPGAGSVQVFRGVLGTKVSEHSVGSVIRRIKPLATELRRHSIIRASGHTFEYVGFGPGNYSTAFPDKHDREINSDEEILAQSMKKEGGVNFYTGMNDKGISYTGNRRVSTITGREEIFETPVRTIKGEDILEEPQSMSSIQLKESSADRLRLRVVHLIKLHLSSMDHWSSTAS